MSLNVQLTISGETLVFRAETIKILNEFYKKHIEYLTYEENLLGIQSDYVMTNFSVVSVYEEYFYNKCIETLNIICDQSNFRYKRIQQKRTVLIHNLLSVSKN